MNVKQPNDGQYDEKGCDNKEQYIINLSVANNYVDGTFNTHYRKQKLFYD